MCRLIAYLGRPVLMEKLLIEPKNSLINQSFNARELEEPLNGDGFGVGWYNFVLSRNPGLFTSIAPAWNNRNLRSIATLVKSTCFMAHVRAASVGELTETNCHPFACSELLMMHNGDAPKFDQYKRQWRSKLSDASYNWIKGQTDSEHLFALFLDKLKDKTAREEISSDLMADALEETVAVLESMLQANGITESSYLNMVVSDGERMVGMRYVSTPEESPLSLYYSAGSRYECNEGVCQMLPAKGDQKSVMIVSERLTDIAEDWKPIPANHFVVVYKDLRVKLRKITPVIR